MRTRLSGGPSSKKVRVEKRVKTPSRPSRSENPHYKEFCSLCGEFECKHVCGGERAGCDSHLHLSARPTILRPYTLKPEKITLELKPLPDSVWLYETPKRLSESRMLTEHPLVRQNRALYYGDFWQDIADFFKRLIEQIINFIKLIIEKIIEFFKNPLKVLKELLETFVKFITGALLLEFLSSFELTKWIFEGLDYLTGGFLTNLKTALNIPAKFVSGQEITKADLMALANVAGFVATVAVGFLTGGATMAIVGATATLLKNGPLGKTVLGRFLIDVISIATGGLLGGSSLAQSFMDAGKGAIMNLATGELAKATGLPPALTGALAGAGMSGLENLLSGAGLAESGMAAFNELQAGTGISVENVENVASTLASGDVVGAVSSGLDTAASAAFTDEGTKAALQAGSSVASEAASGDVIQTAMSAVQNFAPGEAVAAVQSGLSVVTGENISKALESGVQAVAQSPTAIAQGASQVAPTVAQESQTAAQAAAAAMSSDGDVAAKAMAATDAVLHSPLTPAPVRLAVEAFSKGDPTAVLENLTAMNLQPEAALAILANAVNPENIAAAITAAPGALADAVTAAATGIVSGQGLPSEINVPGIGPVKLPEGIDAAKLMQMLMPKPGGAAPAEEAPVTQETLQQIYKKFPEFKFDFQLGPKRGAMQDWLPWIVGGTFLAGAAYVIATQKPKKSRA